MNNIQYGNYIFNPNPIWSLDNEAIAISGRFDQYKQTISLIGQLTGGDLSALKIAKENLIEACSSGYLNLNMHTTGFNYAKPIGIEFPDGKLNRILPYTITFESYQEQVFSEYYGILEPKDSWTFQEQNGRRIEAVHTVSAQGNKIDELEGLINARNFVNSQMNGFENLSLFHSGDTFILDNTTESIDRLTNKYSATQTWSLSTALNGYDQNNCIIRPQASIVFQDELSLSVNGTIEAGISGVADTGYFTPEHAKEFAQSAIEKYRSTGEVNLYGNVLSEPSNYTYTIDELGNKIDFNFEFSDPDSTNTGDVRHEYSINFEFASEQQSVNANLEGTVFYQGIRDIFTNTVPESGIRFQKVNDFFETIDPYVLAQSNFAFVNGAELPYNDQDLNTRFQNYTITKLPFDSRINYSYSYSNVINPFEGFLNNPNISLTRQYGLPQYKITPTLDKCFAVQELYDTLDRVIINVQGQLVNDVDVFDSLNIVSGWIEQYSDLSGTILSDTCETGNGTLSLNKTFLIT